MPFFIPIFFLLLPIIGADYEDSLARNKFYPAAAASQSLHPEICIGAHFPNSTVEKRVVVNCDVLNQTNPNENITCVGFVAIARGDSAIVISFDGTSSQAQYNEEIASGKYPPVNTSFGGVNVYFYEATLMVWNGGLRDAFFSAVQNNPEFELWITGHSLGASLASVMAAYIIANGLMDPNKIKLITFGQARTGDSAYAAFIDKNLNYTYRVTHALDPVVHLPSLRNNTYGYRHSKNEVWYNNWMLPGSSYVKCPEDESMHCSDIFDSLVGQWSAFDHVFYFFEVVSTFGQGGCVYLFNKNDRRKLLINGRPSSGLVPYEKFSNAKVQSDPSNAQYITQPVDHFDSTNKNTFQQRFWANDEFWNPFTDNAAFLMIGGDAPTDYNVVTNHSGLLFAKIAKDYGAYMFNLEHRYYGNSSVTPDLSTPNMKYLSSRQALGDIKNFIQEMNKKFGIDKGVKWVLFGGSYAGALAAWAEELYPDLILGSVASSAMVQAVVDNTGYLEVVDQVLSETGTCADELHEVLMEIQNMMTNANGRQKLFKGFQLCQPLDPNNKKQLSYFYNRIIEPFMFGVTYGGHIDVCNVLTNKTFNTLGNMYAVSHKFNNYSSCLDVDYNDYIKYLQNTNLDNSDRAWFYQTCQEFGFYQSSNHSSFYGNILPVGWYVEQCQDVFGTIFNNATIYSNVNKTNGFYHGQNGYQGSNTIFPSGTADPWHILGVLYNNGGSSSIVINDTWHCADMGDYSKNANLAQLNAAKQQIEDELLGLFMNCNNGC